jgi:hypothetical protein
VIELHPKHENAAKNVDWEALQPDSLALRGTTLQQAPESTIAYYKDGSWQHLKKQGDRFTYTDNEGNQSTLLAGLHQGVIELPDPA